MVDLSAVTVRAARLDDAPALAQLYHASVHGVGAQYYSDEQVHAWSPAPADPQRFEARIGDGRTTLLATAQDGAILAYGDVEADGHVDHLYARPDVAGTGVTAQLYEHLEAAARGRGITRLFVEASEPASRFFARQGFRIIERSDFEIGGVPIHNFRMEKPLEP